MSANFEGGVASNRKKKLSTTNVTELVEAGGFLVKAVYATEIASSTATFSLEIYDGTSSFYLMKAKPMTALQTLQWDDIPLEVTESLRVTAGTADKIDVVAVVVQRKI